MKANLEIDVLRLLAGKIKGFENAQRWNAWLTRCLRDQKMDELISVRKGIQIGMHTAQKKGLVNEQVAETYCRWIGSIDKTLRRILKARNPMLNDKVGALGTADSLEAKRQRDAEFERFLRKKGSY